MNLELMALVRDFEAHVTDAEVFSSLSEKDAETTDSSLYSYRELVRRFGPSVTSLVLGKLKAAAV